MKLSATSLREGLQLPDLRLFFNVTGGKRYGNVKNAFSTGSANKLTVI